MNKSTVGKSLSEKEILSCLGKVLSNARDWHGRRKTVQNISIPTSSAPITTDSQEALNTFFFINENDQIEFVTAENQVQKVTNSLHSENSNDSLSEK